MNIREVEERTGLTRANVRFYEKEELLSPERKENGYRDYSEGDVEILLKIKLLRKLGISLEEIRHLQREETVLDQVLRQRMEAIGQEQTALENSRVICEEIRAGGVMYRELDAERYLEALAGLEKQAEQQGYPCPSAGCEEDVIPESPHPWRRYFARSVDGLAYSLLFFAGYFLVLRGKPLTGNWSLAVRVAAEMGIMLLVEPLLLSWFGTTLGKWMMGIRVTADGERRLRLSDGIARTAAVLWYGEGLGIPGYGIYRNIRSYRTSRDGGKLPWEDESVCSYRDIKNLRWLGIGAAYGIYGVLLFGIFQESELPLHRGDISASQFVENYNRYLEYYGDETGKLLGMDGAWEKKERPGMNQGVEIVMDTGSYTHWEGDTATVWSTDMQEIPLPEFTFREEDGVLREVSFAVDYRGTGWIDGYHDEVVLAVYSFACAQREVKAWNGRFGKIAEYLENHRFESFRFTEGDVTVTCDVSLQGYDQAGTLLLPASETKPGEFHLTLIMEKSEG